MTDQDPLDDRLRSYLRARADVAVPDGLVESVRVTKGPTARVWRSWPRMAFALVAVMVAAVLVGTRVLNEPTRVAVAPSPSNGASIGGSPAASPQVVPDATLHANGFPDTVLGLPVISVSAARNLIAGRQYLGRAMAVGGWWSSASVAMGCPMIPAYQPPIFGWCAEDALSPTDAVAGHRGSDGSYSWGPPPGSILARDVRETAGGSELWKNVDPQSDARELPQRVVIIAHTGDVRARQCNAQTIATCEQLMIIDAFAWVEGRVTDALVITAGTWHLSSAAARAAIGAALPAGQLVAFGPQTSDFAQQVDPRLPIDSSPVWIGRVITGPPDAAGTTALEEVVVSDTSGLTQILPMSFLPGTELGTVQFGADGNFFKQDGQLPTLYAAVIDSAGNRLAQTRLQENWNVPAVLPVGHYDVVSWWGDSNTPVAAPSPPPQPTCRGSVDVLNGDVAWVSINWGSSLFCQIVNGIRL